MINRKIRVKIGDFDQNMVRITFFFFVTFELDDVDNVIVKGSLGFNAETYELETFSYDLKDYFKTVFL